MYDPKQVMSTEEVLEKIPRSTMPVHLEDGQLGVVYSPGYGSGMWSLPHSISYLRHHRDLVLAAETGDLDHFREVAKNLGVEFQMSCSSRIDVEYLPLGTAYEITEHDGYESVNRLYGEYQVVY